MEPPARDMRELVEITLCNAEVLKRLRAGKRENKSPELPHAHQHRNSRLRDVDDVRLAVLGARGRKRPGLAGKVDLVPGQSSDFFAPLPGQCQQFDNTT